MAPGFERLARLLDRPLQRLAMLCRHGFEHLNLPSAGHPPLYPALLAVISALGGTSVMWHRAAGLLFGALSIALMGALGRRLGGERLGLVAAAIWLGYEGWTMDQDVHMSKHGYIAMALGIFFSLMIAGLAHGLPQTLSAALRHYGVCAGVAERVAQLPPVSSLFAALLGVNPIRQLLVTIDPGLFDMRDRACDSGGDW